MVVRVVFFFLAAFPQGGHVRREPRGHRRAEIRVAFDEDAGRRGAATLQFLAGLPVIAVDHQKARRIGHERPLTLANLWRNLAGQGGAASPIKPRNPAAYWPRFNVSATERKTPGPIARPGLDGEELFAEDETSRTEVHPKVFEAHAVASDPAHLDAALARLEAAGDLPEPGRRALILRELQLLVPTYAPSATGLGRYAEGFVARRSSGPNRQAPAGPVKNGIQDAV